MKIHFDLKLIPLDSTDVERIRSWRNDYRIWRWCRQSDLISDVEQRDWYTRQSLDPTIRMYGIGWSFEGKHELVGVCGLTSLDWLNRRAEFSLYTAPEHHGKGFGRAALRLLLLHAFGNLNLEQIWGEAIDGNPAIKTFEAMGFKRDGLRRRFYWKDGAPHDAVLFSILRREFFDANRPAGAPDSPPAGGSGRPGGGPHVDDVEGAAGASSECPAEDPAPAGDQEAQADRPQ